MEWGLRCIMMNATVFTTLGRHNATNDPALTPLPSENTHSHTTGQVAFTSPANAAPYLYSVPPDLACFATLLKRFGVRQSFGPSDFCHALRRLAVETGAADSDFVSPAAAAAAASAEADEAKSAGGGMVSSLMALASTGVCLFVFACVCWWGLWGEGGVVGGML